MDKLSESLELFCVQLQADPLTYDPAIIVNYVRHLYELGAGVQFCEFP